MRMRGEEVVITEKSEVPGKRGARFTAVATTGRGDIVAGMNTGELKLFSKPEGGWTRAKTNLTQLSAPVTGPSPFPSSSSVLHRPLSSRQLRRSAAVDVSFDGEWVLWTTKEFLALMSVKFRDEKSGRFLTGFEKSIPTDQRVRCAALSCARVRACLCVYVRCLGGHAG